LSRTIHRTRKVDPRVGIRRTEYASFRSIWTDPKDNEDFVDATSDTVTPASEPADPLEERGGMRSWALKGPNGNLKREKSPLKYENRLSNNSSEPLTEISLDDATAIHSTNSSDASTDATSAVHGAFMPSGPPELPPRKRGSVSSASSGVQTPPVQPPPPALPSRRGPPPPPALPPRSSIASVNYAPALPNIDLLIARLEEQSKLIKEGDEKVREEYAVGKAELRKSFQRIQREFQPNEGEEDEIDWGEFRLYSSG
jgi:hypothetical protein